MLNFDSNYDYDYIYNMTYQKNSKGFAHIGIIAVLTVITLVVVVGLLVFRNRDKTSSKTETKQTQQKLTPKQIEATKVVTVPDLQQKGDVTGSFVQNNGVSWPDSQQVGYIGVTVSNPANVSKVEWYLNNLDRGSLKYAQTKASVGSLYQYDWSLQGLPGGVYHWLAKIYDKNGKVQLAKNNLGDSYIDMIVNVAESTNDNGTVSGTFVQQNNVSWPGSQSEAYVGVSVDNLSKISKVEWYLGSFSPENMLASQAGGGVKNLNDAGGLVQYNWPISQVPSGTYRILARVYDSAGNYQVVKNSQGGLFVDMKIKS